METRARQWRQLNGFLRHTAKNVFKKTSITHNGHTIDFSKKFVVVSYFDLLKQYAHISDPMGMTRDETALSAKRLGIDVAKSDSREKIFDNIYKKTCRPKLINPTFIVDYPAHMLPLAKRAESGSEFVDAFQLVAGGIELAKGFSELNDPIDQAERFKRQDEDRKAGDAEAQTSDTAFLEAMEHGMPPAGGVGIGIERLGDVSYRYAIRACISAVKSFFLISDIETEGIGCAGYYA